MVLHVSENVVIDLENRTVTRYVTRYNTRYVTNYRYNTIYRSRIVNIATAVIVNYVLNGKVVTSLTIPTNLVLGESVVEGSAVGSGAPYIRTPKEYKPRTQPPRKGEERFVMV